MADLLQKILTWDYKITQKFTIGKEPKWRWLLATLIAHSGDSWYCLGVLLIVWLLTDGMWHQISAAMGSATFLLAIIVILIKFSVKRRRPEGDWGGIYRKTDPHSFPSGHATRVFFLASMAWGIAPPWLAILLSIWAPFVALSRIITGLHYASDVIAGVIIGWVLGQVAVFVLPWIMQAIPFIF